ncbi:MAG: hypothetical protein E7139_07280 [Rikenellaceae bacterium]|nr:hypothetical protein [Rikenellaceae bacterium]
MKNIFRILMAVAVLFTASCAKEEISSSIAGGEVEVTFTASLQDLGSRAYGDGSQVNTLRFSVYDAVSGEKLTQLCGEKSPISASTPTTVNLVLLKGMKYNITFWADCNKLYNFDGQVVTVDYNNVVANDEERDAFYAYVENFDPAVATSEDTTIELYRPFAQLNAISTDAADALTNSGVTISKSTVKAELYNSFNLTDGTVSNLAEKTLTADDILSAELLSMNYLFAPAEGYTPNVTFTFENNKGIDFGASFSYVPLKRNYRTNIIGSLLTKPTDFTVEIEAGFNEPDKDVVQTAAELQQQIENAPDGEETEIVLGGDIDLNDLLGSLGTLSTRAATTPSLTISAGKNIVLNLNGCTLSATEDSTGSYALITNKGTLTISDSKGSGKIELTATVNRYWNSYSSVISNTVGGVLTVNGGTIEHLGGTDMAYGIDNLTNGKGTSAVATINGGVVKSTYIGIRQFLNGVEATNSLTVNGGEIHGVKRSVWMQGPSANKNSGELVVAADAKLYGNAHISTAEGTADWDVTMSIAAVALQGESTVAHGILPEGYSVVEENGYWVVNKNYKKTENGYEIYTAGGLKWLASEVNGGTNDFAGETITLANDINLNNVEWTKIGTETNPFSGSFDGNGHVIKNLNIVEAEAKEGKAYIGFFGYAKNATIKNVTFENVNLNIPCLDIDHSQGHIGAVAGSLEGTSTIENVTVKGNIYVESTVTANGASRVAVVAGGNSYGNVTMKNVHVVASEGSYLKANNNVGSLAGQLQGKNVFENCSSNINVTGTKFFAGGIIGLAAGDSQFTNCHTTGNVAVTAGREGRAHDQYRVGGIAGGWSDGAKNVCTLTNCSYDGELYGANVDGSVTEVFDYAGYVGRGYTLNGCAGSKVVIDGTEYVQAYNTAAEAGLYIVDDVYEVGTLAALKIVANKVNSGAEYYEGKNIKLIADIDLNDEEWTPIGSATKDHGFCGNFDGNGKKIKNLNITALVPDADNYVYAGLFGVTEGTETAENTIKNLVIENVNISTTGHIVSAAIAYPYYTTVENITVQGDINITGGDYTAGVLAYTRRCVNASNIAINGNTGSTITGRHTVGGVISDIQMNGGLTAAYSNFSASNLTITATDMHVGGISGIISRQTLDGATVKNVTIVCDDVRKGIVSGALGGESTIKNIVHENVTGATNIVGATYDNGSAVTNNGDVYTAAE